MSAHERTTKPVPRRAFACMVVLTLALAGCTTGDPPDETNGGTPTTTTPTTATPPTPGDEPRDERTEFDGLLLPPGVEGEVIAANVTFPSSVEWDDEGNAYVALSLGPQRGIYRVDGGELTQVFDASNLTPQLLDITWHEGWMYMSTTGRVHRLDMETMELETIIDGLPAWGDHRTDEIAFGPDGRLYVGQGSVTNSGVVGLDQAGAPNAIVDLFGGGPGEGEGSDGQDSRAVSSEDLRNTHDIPCVDVTVTGVNYETTNPVDREVEFDTYIGAGNDTRVVWFNSSEEIPEDARGLNGTRVTTGPFAPLGTPRHRGETVPGDVKCNGAILSANPDGSDLRVAAWGFRNPFGVGFDADGQLWVTDNAYDKRGSRPVGATPDGLYRVTPGEGGEAGAWHGWPEYAAGVPVTDPFFAPPYGPPVHEVLLEEPNAPPPPTTFFAAHSSADKFDFAPQGSAWAGNLFVAEFGSLGYSFANNALSGMAVTRVEMETGKVTEFIVSQNRWSGDFRPVEAVFGPDGRLFVVDFGEVTTELLPEEEARLFNQTFVPQSGRLLAFRLPAESDWSGRPAGSIGGDALEATNVATDAGEGATEVQVIDYGFAVPSDTVQVGDAIVFRNIGDVGHTATAYDGAFNTGLALAPGTAASWTPEQAGTYAFFCMVHPVMVGEIVVEEAT